MMSQSPRVPDVQIMTVVYVDGRELPALNIDMAGAHMLPALIRVQVATAAALLAEGPTEDAKENDEPATPA